MIRRQVIGAGLILGILGGLLIDTHFAAYPHTFQTQFVYAAVEQPNLGEVIQIKLIYNEAQITEMIRETFPEEPETMLRVARCESGLIPTAQGPTNDHGIYQIHVPSHSARIVGLDLYDPKVNIAFARKLYDESGKNPWNASRKCWQ